ncbi:glucose 1-dehydrogenase [Trichodelitschia bisporula]|uniref:Glucose 1-dehydrogenase n=1 Tax=Trichodelitschia bisporula TaxID=703511 RepID=A0A6G1IA05_9PEZI|nr:glucose 1-dehydrogenase [Trichodelitschia bisporula]
MSEANRTAYITGGASGIGLAVATMLVEKGARVFLADFNLAGATKAAEELTASSGRAEAAAAAHVNVAEWDSQVKAFTEALKWFGGRVDYVLPIAGIGERVWLRNVKDGGEGFEKPNLEVLDVDLNGVLYTTALGIQQFRRQPVGSNGFKGKIVTVASICGLYCVSTLPIYTTAKHGVVGFVRSYGKLLPAEGITLNAACPNIVRTNIAAAEFYDDVNGRNQLTPIENVVTVFEELLGDSKRSGETIEVGPKSTQPRVAPEYCDHETELLCEMLEDRGAPLHVAR